jgi:hypothetical protein
MRHRRKIKSSYRLAGLDKENCVACKHESMNTWAMKRYTLDLTEELHKKLKVHCAIEGLEMSEVIRKLIADYLEKAEKKHPKK